MTDDESAALQEPMTDEAIEEFKEAMGSQRQEVREALAEDLGGDPEDYDAEEYLRDSGDRDRARADGGE